MFLAKWIRQFNKKLLWAYGSVVEQGIRIAQTAVRFRLGPPYMSQIQTGNFNTEDQTHRQWVIGHFINSKSVFHNTDFEIRWANHKKGEKKDSPTSSEMAKTVSILVSGKCKLWFPEEDETIFLELGGDYVYFDKKTLHGFEALEDCLIITIRWPSLPDAQSN